jgi:1-acyl-sn-glycerol-3-phosphate acyltransferase
MIIFKYTFWILYRLWFYILVIIPIIILFPILIVSVSKEEWYPLFFRIARLWSTIILVGMGFRWKIEKEQILEEGKSYMFIANHTSMIDIMLMLVTIKNPFVFVGKKELTKIPLFGFFYRKTCILVDRSSLKSRQAVFLRAQRRLKQGLSICIFPEGGVPEEDVLLDDFKDGAFKMAIAHNIPVVPMTFYDNKKRFSFTFLSGSPGLIRAKVHSFFETAILQDKDRATLREEVRTIILKELMARS